MSCNAKNCPAQIIKITDDLCEQWDCEWRKPKTNADRIRSMSDEEFSHFLFGIQCAPASKPKEWLDWLRQEAQEGE